MLTHKGTQSIKTNRLILRRFALDDAKAMFDNWASDERVTKFLTWTPHENAEQTRELLKWWCEDYKKDDNYNWIIEHESTVIGSISVTNINEHSEYAEIGYCLSFEYWNKGYISEALRVVVDFLFREVGFNKIIITHAVKNPASGKVAQKCGFTLDGTKRKHFKSLYNGEFLDTNEYSLLREEWLKL